MSAPSSASAQFGRAWRLEVETTPDASGATQTVTAFSAAWEPEPLDIEFDTYQSTTTAFWYCDVTIYNLNAPTEQLILKQGMKVTLWGGYQNQPYGVLFSGRLWQPLWERTEATSFKLTLHCMVGVAEMAENWVAEATGRELSQRDIITRMAERARTPLQIESLDTTVLPAITYPRGQVIFGNPGRIIHQTARGAGLNAWVSQTGINIRSLRQASQAPQYTFGPDTGLVGTPQITQDGVAFRVLLDARIGIAELVKLDQSVIRQQARMVGNYPTILDHDGIYTVGSIRHFGESRGSQWYTEIVAYTNVGGFLAVNAANGAQ